MVIKLSRVVFNQYERLNSCSSYTLKLDSRFFEETERTHPVVLYSTEPCVWCFLKRGKPFLPGLPFLQLSYNRASCRPSPFSRSLSRLRVKFVSPRKLLSKNSAISTQFVLPSFLAFHPVFDATIADKSRSPNGFIKPFMLLFFPFKLCLKN